MNTLASACGKIILTGEHAVVYHQPGIAVPLLSLRATCKVRASEAAARLRAPDLGLDLDLTRALSAAEITEHALVTTVRRALGRLAIPVADCPGLCVSSQIPIKRGLGSGSAISAAIYQALATHFKLSSSPQELYDFVQEIEAIYHGRPSGIDAQVIAYEQAVYFRREQAPQLFQTPRGLSLLVIDSGPAAATHEVVNWVAEQMRLQPQIYPALMPAIGKLSEALYRLLAENAVFDQPAQGQALGDLLNHNQALLQAMGVSGPAQDQLIERLRQAGAWGAKLSGAGRGGVCIAIGPDLDALQKLAETFAYPCWQVHF